MLPIPRSAPGVVPLAQIISALSRAKLHRGLAPAAVLRVLIVGLALSAVAPAGAQSTCDCVFGKVGFFGFNVQIAQPKQDAQGLARYNAIFSGVARFNMSLRQAATCLFPVDGTAYNAQFQGGALRSGPGVMNLPPPGQIKDLDYLTTGEVAAAGNVLTITARIEAAYSRETVKSASVTTGGDPEQVMAAMDALAAKMGPLSQTLTEFEKRKRASDSKYARSTKEGTIQVTMKRLAMDGERVEVKLQMTDCDGYPLANRELRFEPGTWEGEKIGEATRGGRVKPSSVVTDGEGKATVQFRVSGAGEAALVAWYGHFRPTGHPHVMLQETKLTVEPYSVRPIFTIAFDEEGGVKDWNYSTKVQTSYALTDGNDGSRAIDEDAQSSEDLYRLRGGIAGLKPGDVLHFYDLEESGSGTAVAGKDPPCSARHEQSRSGQFQTWVNGQSNGPTMKPTTVRNGERIYAGEVIMATLTRTPQGATLTYAPRTVMEAGCEFLNSPLHNFGFTPSERRSGIGMLSFTESDLQNWGQVSKAKQGTLENTESRDLGTAVISLKVTLMGWGR